MAKAPADPPPKRTRKAPPPAEGEPPKKRTRRSSASPESLVASKTDGRTRAKAKWKFHACDLAGQDEIDNAVADPDLMDVRRPLGVMDVVVRRTQILPTREGAARTARRKNMAAAGPALLAAIGALADTPEEAKRVMEELIAPTEEDIDAVLKEQHDDSLRMLATMSKRQVEAVKALEWAKVISQQVVPVLAEFGLKLTVTLRKFVAPHDMDACMEEVRRAGRVTIGELAGRSDSDYTKAKK